MSLDRIGNNLAGGWLAVENQKKIGVCHSHHAYENKYLWYNTIKWKWARTRRSALRNQETGNSCRIMHLLGVYLVNRVLPLYIYITITVPLIENFNTVKSSEMQVDYNTPIPKRQTIKVIGSPATDQTGFKIRKITSSFLKLFRLHDQPSSHTSY